VLDVIFEFIDEVNAYFSSQAPWLLAKTDVRAMEEVLFITLEAARYPVTLLLPFIPDSASKILSMLGIHNASFSTLNRQHHIAPGYKLGDVAPVFPRILN
jgi:methionyl-tRNA synthetase